MFEASRDYIDLRLARTTQTCYRKSRREITQVAKTQDVWDLRSTPALIWTHSGSCGGPSVETTPVKDTWWRQRLNSVESLSPGPLSTFYLHADWVHDSCGGLTDPPSWREGKPQPLLPCFMLVMDLWWTWHLRVVRWWLWQRVDRLHSFSVPFIPFPCFEPESWPLWNLLCRPGCPWACDLPASASRMAGWQLYQLPTPHQLCFCILRKTFFVLKVS